MNAEFLIRAPVGLLPVLAFLVALLYLDSYKLVSFRTVLVVIATGALVTVASYFINGFLFTRLPFEFASFSRYVAPVVEEVLKALVIVYLFQRQPRAV